MKQNGMELGVTSKHVMINCNSVLSLHYYLYLFRSREWSVVSDEEKRQLGLMFDADGEFWMSYADFKKNFTNIEITNLTPDSLDEGKLMLNRLFLT